MILFLDTSDFNKLHFALIDNGKIKERFVSVKYNESEKTLPELKKMLGKNILKLQVIYAVSGPGSFTGIRVGISIALAFSLAAGIPVYALKKDQVPENLFEISKIKNLKKIASDFDLDYGAEPNITKPKI